MPSATLSHDTYSNMTRVIPDRSYTVVEHPGIIKNVDNCVASLGGHHKIGQFVHSKNEKKFLGFLLRPEDPFRKYIGSQLVDTQNLVLKITVPRRTGRKRKRGSNDPYQFHNEDAQTSETPVYDETRQQLRALQDNPEGCSVEVAGTVAEAHRFRTLPDFQFALIHNSMAQEFRKHILPFKYEDLKNFSLKFNAGFTKPEMEMFPPPAFAQLTIPFNYQYLQNPYVKLTTNATGNPTSINNYAPRKIYSTLGKPLEKGVPTSVNPLNQPLSQHNDTIRGVVAELRTLFETRPVMTRRVILNRISRVHEYNIKIALPYVSYMYRSGPWRDAFIRLGYDPRLDPTSRMYQTITFKIQTLKKSDEAPIPVSRSTPPPPPSAPAQTPNVDSPAAAAASAATVDDQAATPVTASAPASATKPVPTPSRTRYSRAIRKVPRSTPSDSHLFTGSGPLHSDAKVWQICDITNPLLRRIIDDAPPRDTCAATNGGWMLPGALAKVRVIMRDMITVMMAGGTPQDGDYLSLVSLPDGTEGRTDKEFDLSRVRGVSQKERELALTIRQEARMFGKGKKTETDANGEGGDGAGDGDVDPALLEDDGEGDEGSDAGDDGVEAS